MAALQKMSAADKFNEWMFNTILPFVEGKVLEIGSGIGNISRHFFKREIPLAMSDLRQDYCLMLREQFKEEPYVAGVHQIDLAASNFDEVYGELSGTFDTVFALNVVEHIQDDVLALENCYKLLAPGGHVIILVPAYQLLYNLLDRELEHYRRYTRQSLIKLVSRDFQVIHTEYFNLAGILGWFYAGTIARRRIVPEGPLTIYNKLVPFFNVLDGLTFKSVGLSVIAVGRKN